MNIWYCFQLVIINYENSIKRKLVKRGGRLAFEMAEVIQDWEIKKLKNSNNRKTW